MRETPFFFPHRNEQLFGFLHEPEGAAALPGFVLCHPFGEEKLWTHRVYVTFARELARRGYPVLRFDYMGNGDSSGRFEESSVSTAVADIGCAIDALKTRTGVEDVAILGLRLGATFASEIAEHRDDVRLLVLWAPIVDGARYMQDLLRVNLTTQMAVYREIRADRAELVEAMKAGGTANVDGYEVSLAMYDELSALKLVGRPRSFGGSCLVVQIDRAQTARPAPEIRQVAQAYPRATFLRVQEDPFWMEIERFYDRAPNLFAATLEWLADPEHAGQVAGGGGSQDGHSKPAFS